MSKDSGVAALENRSASAWWCAAIGILGAAFVLLATSKYGISHHSDSARYISVARSIAVGQGFTLYDGRPEVWSTPLYPVVLSIAVWLDADILVFSRYLHAFLYGLTLFLGAGWLVSLGITRFTWFTATCLVLFSASLFEQATTALTDMLFVVFVMLSLVCLDRFLLRPSMPRLLVAAGCVALAWLSRYVGITLVMAGAVLVFLPRAAGWRERLRDSVVFGVVSGLPAALWLARNYLATGAAMTTNAEPTISFLGYFQLIVTIMGTWFLPPRIPESVRAALGLAILVCTAAALAWSARKTLFGVDSDAVERWTAIRTSSLFALIYIAFVNVAISITYATDRPDRYLAPAIIPVVGLLAVGAEEVVRRIGRHKPLLQRSLALASVLVLVWPVRYFVGSMKYSLEHGAGGYATDRWQRSETLRYLRSHTPGAEFYTNEPNAIYFHGGTSRARWLPPHGLPGEPTEPAVALQFFRDSLSATSDVLVVLFTPDPPDLEAYSYTKPELEKVFDAALIASFSDGSLYGLRPRPAAAPFAESNK